MRKGWEYDWNLVLGYHYISPEKENKIKDNCKKYYKSKRDEKNNT